MSRRHFLISGVVAGMLALGIAIYFATDSGLSRQSQALPDGSILTVRKLTSGRKNRLVEGNLFQRMGGLLLPESWAGRLGANFTVLPVETELPVLWMERRWPTNTPRPGIFPVPFTPGMAFTNRPGSQSYTTVMVGSNRLMLLAGRPSYRLFTTAAASLLPGTMPSMKSSFNIVETDAAGTRIDAPVWVFSKSLEYDLMPILLQTLPTDCRTIRLVLQPGGGMEELLQRISFDIPNPSFLRSHKWPAAPCPRVVEQDGLTFRLEHFGPPEPFMVRDPLHPDTDLTVEIRDSAGSNNEWGITGLRILNEAGDESAVNLRRYKYRGARASYWFPGTLSTNLSWKLRFRLDSSSLTSNLVQTFRLRRPSIVLGTGAEVLRTPFHGLSLVIKQRSSPDQFTAAINPPDEKWRLRLLEIRDPDGQTNRFTVSDEGVSGLFFQMTAGPQFKTNLDLTFGLRRQLFIDVLAQPGLEPAR